MLKWPAAVALFVGSACSSSTPPPEAPSEPDALLADADGAPASPDFEQGVDAIGKGDFAKAHGHFQNVLKSEPDNAQANFYAGVAEQNLGRSAEAAQSYERAVTLNPGLADGWVNWSALHLDAGEFDKALDVSERGLAKNRAHGALLYNRALALSGAGKSAEAVAAYRAASEADPGNVEIKYGYAEALLVAGSNDAALKILDELVQSSDVAVLASSARLLGRLKQFDACVAALTKAIGIKPSAELFVDRGLCQHGKKDEAAAFADFQAGVKADAGYAPAHYYTGMHLKTAGKKAEARAALSKAASIAGDSGVGKAAKRALESL